MNEGALNICRNAGIRMEDVEFINLYNEYARLFAEGEKVSYIVAVLSCKYGICERKVYALIKRFKSDCNSLIFGGGNY